MKHIGEQIKQARLEKHLSISDVSRETSIRPHIIQAIEDGDFTVLPEVYIKSFIKTLFDFFEIEQISIIEKEIKAEESNTEQINGTKAIESSDKINFDDIEEVAIPPKKIEKVIEFIPEKTDDKGKKKIKPEKKRKFDDEKPEFVSKSLPIESSKADSDFSEIFKRKRINIGMNPSLINYLVYAGVALVIIVAIYFTFFFNSGPFASKKTQESTTKADTTIVESNNLFDYFAASDTLSLVAKASDSAWLKIEIDGKRSEEMLMLPGMERNWSAGDFIILHVGNIGAVQFYRNGELLAPLGRKGSVVKNIRITRSEVLNSSPWNEDPSSRFGAVDEVPRETKRYTNQKKKEDEKPKTIEPSQIETRKPSLLQGDN